MGSVCLFVLGAVRVEHDGVLVQGFESRKSLALLAYLALHSQPQSRSYLAELFWEGKPEERSRGNLNRVLHNLTRLLPGCLEATRQTIGIAAAGIHWLDAREFDSLATHDDLLSLAQAAELYRGDLLSNLQLDDCPEFEHWLEGAREQWRQRQIRVLQRLIEHHLHHGSPNEGIVWATRLLEIEPWQEEAHRAMMLLLFQSGRRGAALAHYEACRRVLGRELGVEPEEATIALYQRIRDGIEPAPPSMGQLLDTPIAHAAVRPRDLPMPPTSFVNRQADLALTLAMLRDPACRLVTILGPGGVGKSRLALQAAHQLAAASPAETIFPHGIIFVPLGAFETTAWLATANPQAPAGHLLATNIAHALNLALSRAATPQVQILDYLREKRALLLLDNGEQLLAATDFLVDLLQQAPGLKVLTTSNSRLHLHGEHTIELDGLHFPQPQSRVVANAWDSYSAITLFHQRAKAVLPHFEMTPADQQAVAKIAQLVDGLPLGIELAASWVRLLPCHEIAQEIASSLDFLRSARRDAPPRHQSLHAVFDYAWNSLSNDQQRLLERLSVFRGGFGRDAAREVAGGTLALLATLLDNSLIRREGANGHEQAPIRYELLEVVRQYAAEKLAEAAGPAGAEAANIQDRYSAFYLNFLRQQTTELRGPRQQVALSAIHREIENIRCAWRWALLQQHVELIDGALDSMFHFYDMRSWFQEGEAVFAQSADLLAQIHATDPTARVAWGRALARQGWFLFHGGNQFKARALLEQSLKLLRAAGAAMECIFPLHRLAAVNLYLGAYAEAEQLGQEALEMSIAHGDPYHVAISKTLLSQIAYQRGHYHAARQLCHDSLAIDRALGNRWGMAFSIMNLGTVAYALEEYREAEACFQEGIAIRETLGDARGIALCLNNLGDVMFAQADYTAAHQHYRASLATFSEIGNQWGVAAALAKLGYHALATQQPDQARDYFMQALRIAQNTQATPRVLDALVGIATLLREEAPERAGFLANLVWQHSSTLQESHNRAAALLARLPDAAPSRPADASEKAYAAQVLNEVVSEILESSAIRRESTQV